MAEKSPADPLRMFLATTPARVSTARFASFFSKPLPHVATPLILKRREPKPERDAQANPFMGWTPSCSDADFESATAILGGWPSGLWLNIENAISESDKAAFLLAPKAGALLSGPELDPDSAAEAWSALPLGRPNIIALENEALVVGAPKLLERLCRVQTPWGVIIGSSYLSEASKMYDQMGLDKYRSLMRVAGKAALSHGSYPISTSNYCTFEATGAGDKNKAFARAQIDYVFGLGRWGCLSRFYHHLELADLAARDIDFPNSSENQR